MSASVQDVKDLLQSARDGGSISPATAVVLQDATQQIQAGLGVAAEDVQLTEVVLVNLFLDDSGSIRFSGNTEAVLEGVAGVLEAVGGAKKRDDVFVLIWLMNKGCFQPYCLLADAATLDRSAYNPNEETPLFKGSKNFLGTVIAKTKEFEDAGTPVRTISLIFTDGGDNASGRVRVSDVASLVSDMLRRENHLIFGFGVEDGMTDFKQVFLDMGIPDEFIMVSSNDKKEIRRRFNLFSQSAKTASQNAGSFSKVAMGGFDLT